MRVFDFEAIAYNLMCGALVSTVTLLVVLPGTWDLPWLLADGYALTHGGVHVDVPLAAREKTYITSRYKGKSSSRTVAVLVFTPPGGKQVRELVADEVADRASASGRVALVHRPGEPQRFKLEGQEWAGVGWRLALIGLIGFAPLLFGIFLSCLDLLRQLRRRARWWLSASGSPPGSAPP